MGVSWAGAQDNHAGAGLLQPNTGNDKSLPETRQSTDDNL